MPDIKRQIKIVTEQHIIDGQRKTIEDFPMREWSIKIFLLDDQGDETAASIFANAEYILHESFGERARQKKTDPPFRIQEEGWGEFELRIILTPIDGGKVHEFGHDLNFRENKYEVKHTVSFRKPTTAQINALRMSGPIPGEGVGGTPGRDSGAGVVKNDKKRKSAGGPGGRDKLEQLEHLAEQIKQIKDKDLYELIEIINDNKNEDSQITNDLDNGEFTVDLYTLPDRAITLLTSYVEEALAR